MSHSRPCGLFSHMSMWRWWRPSLILLDRPLCTWCVPASRRPPLRGVVQVLLSVSECEVGQCHNHWQVKRMLGVNAMVLCSAIEVVGVHCDAHSHLASPTLSPSRGAYARLVLRHTQVEEGQVSQRESQPQPPYWRGFSGGRQRSWLMSVCSCLLLMFVFCVVSRSRPRLL